MSGAALRLAAYAAWRRRPAQPASGRTTAIGGYWKNHPAQWPETLTSAISILRSRRIARGRGVRRPMATTRIRPCCRVRSGQLAIDVNFAARTYTFFVDGSSLGGAFKFDDEVGDTNVLRRGSMVTYARPDGEGFLRNNYVVHFDNFSITSR